jgi:hypothetical protein
VGNAVVVCGGDAAAAVACGRLAHEDGARRSGARRRRSMSMRELGGFRANGKMTFFFWKSKVRKNQFLFVL